LIHRRPAVLSSERSGGLELNRYPGHSRAEVYADNCGGMPALMFAAMFGRAKVPEPLRAPGASLQRRIRIGLSANFLVIDSNFFARRFRRRQLQPA